MRVILLVAVLVSTEALAGDLLPLRGICYAPLPCLNMDEQCAASEDMAQEGYRPQWGAEGRDDLAIMKGMGANVIRLYHPIGEPRAPQPDASGFLDASEDAGLKVFGAVHQYLWCENDDCYPSWFTAVQDGLAKGFAKDGAWHPSVWAMNLINEVDAHVGPQERHIKRLISAVDGLLAAEKAAGIKGNVNLTSCFTTALAPPLGGGPVTVYHGFLSVEAWLKNPSLVEYEPRSGSIADLVSAVDQRWVHCVNAQIPWEYGLKGMLADQYSPLLPRPWFIGEMGFNGAHGDVLQKELEAMHTYATEGKGFLGTFFFQFQTAYFKGRGVELNFGMFGLGPTQVGNTGELGGQSFPVHCLTSRLWAFEQPDSGCKDECSHRAQAVAKAFGGQISGRGVCLDAPPFTLDTHAVASPSVPSIPPRSSCASFEAEAVDTDMSGVLLAERWAATSDDCCPLCEETTDCEGYAYVNQVCYLKGNFTGTYYNWGVVTRLASRMVKPGCSGFAVAQQDQDLAGKLLEDWYAPAPEVCCAACTRKEDCGGFSFVNSRCYLKGDIEGTYDLVGALTRVKESGVRRLMESGLMVV